MNVDHLLAQLEPAILRTAAALASGRPDLVDELAQEGRIGAWRALERYEEGSTVAPERFAQIAGRFAMLDALRREGRQGAGEELPELLGEGATVEDLVGGAEDWRRGLALLPERSAIVLRASAAGWSAAELALVLGLSEDRTRQLRLDALRELVQHRGERAASVARAKQDTRRKPRSSGPRAQS